MYVISRVLCPLTGVVGFQPTYHLLTKSVDPQVYTSHMGVSENRRP